MFGRKGKEKPKERAPRSNASLSQFGLMDVPGMDSMGNLDDMLGEDDQDLEAELAALMSGGGGGRQRPKPKPKPEPNLDQMVADCMKDYDSNDEMSDSEDPDLLAELQGMEEDGEEAVAPRKPDIIQPVQQEPVYGGQSLLSIIQDRISVYKEAEAVAKHNGDSSKARRCARGLKTLQDLERRVKTGAAVNEDDIPPQISIGTRKQVEEPSPPISDDPSPLQEQPPPPLPPQPTISQAPPPYVSPPYNDPSPPTTQIAGNSSDDVKSVIQTRRSELRQHALQAKNNNDKPSALEYMKRIKMCDQLLVKVEQDQLVSSSEIPDTDLRVSQQPPQHTPPAQEAGFNRDAPVQVPSNPNEIPAPEPELFGAPPAPATILDALTQRMEKYKAEENKAKAAENNSKARRMGRIVKQYQEAIKLHKMGRPFPRGELPDPPGFAPIPLADKPGSSAAPPKPAPAAATAPAATTAATAASSSGPSPSSGGNQPAASGSSPGKPVGQKVARQSSMMSVQDKQLAALVKRQKLFKEAALQAKQQGQLDTAREYLRQVMGLNKLIEVSKAGLPVDMTTLPTPPQLQIKTDMEFEIVNTEDCKITGDRVEMYGKLERDLIEQVKMCLSNSSYFKEVGDISSSNKFQQMALHSKKDLDAVRFAFKRGDAVPKFYYETRAFSRVVSHTDLTDNDLELTIMSGINYVVKDPKEVDTFIKWEFPFPKDAPPTDKTAVVKDSNNPTYEEKFMLVINPRDKNFQRTVKRHAVKLEVWNKTSFFRSDVLIGTATVKLAELDTKCEIHDTFDLYNGRKPVGGKVEVKVRLRNPILTKQIEQAQEKWLVVKFA